MKGVPLLYWHDQFFFFVGAEFEQYIEVSPAMTNKINFFEAWVMVDIDEVFESPLEFTSKFPEESCTIKAKLLPPVEVPIRVFFQSGVRVVVVMSLINPSIIKKRKFYFRFSVSLKNTNLLSFCLVWGYSYRFFLGMLDGSVTLSKGIRLVKLSPRLGLIGWVFRKQN